MEMEMHHRLSGGAPDVHADVVPVGVVPLVRPGPRPDDDLEEGRALLRGRVKEGGDVPEGKGEEVSPGDGEPVRSYISEIILKEDVTVRRVAEGAPRHGLGQPVSPRIHEWQLHPEKG